MSKRNPFFISRGTDSFLVFYYEIIIIKNNRNPNKSFEILHHINSIENTPILHTPLRYSKLDANTVTMVTYTYVWLGNDIDVSNQCSLKCSGKSSKNLSFRHYVQIRFVCFLGYEAQFHTTSSSRLYQLIPKIWYSIINIWVTLRTVDAPEGKHCYSLRWQWKNSFLSSKILISNVINRLSFHHR